MSPTAWLDPVRAELDALGHPKEVFVRDDRAGWRDDRLEDLLEVFSAHGLACDVEAGRRTSAPRPDDLRPQGRHSTTSYVAGPC